MRAIAHTAYAREDHRWAVRAAGFARHLAKPVDSDELIGVIRDVLDGAAPRSGRAA